MPRTNAQVVTLLLALGPDHVPLYREFYGGEIRSVSLWKGYRFDITRVTIGPLRTEWVPTTPSGGFLC